jgi:hypothetical protein
MSAFDFYSGLIGSMFLVALFSSIVGLACYIIGAVGLFTMAKNRGEEYPWLAFIPIGNVYLIGKMVDSLVLFDRKITNLAAICPAANIVLIFLSSIPFIGGLITFIAVIFLLIVVFHFFRQYRDDTFICVVFTVLPFVGCFVLRNAPRLR